MYSAFEEVPVSDFLRQVERFCFVSVCFLEGRGERVEVGLWELERSER